MLQVAWRKQGEPVPTNPLEQIYSDHHGMVFRTAYRITGNPADAEDVMQTVFLRVMGRDAGAAPIAQPESYLRRAAVHASLDLLRQRQSQKDKAEASPPGEASSDPELQHALRQALGRLDARHAEMFVLRFFEGHDNGDIAAMMGISKIGVAVTLFRVRQRLQKEFLGGSQ
ncbi:MAG: sigma-70 family RNA polymerase sigma factor [Acidobacteria bacterium]|nr:sigma-70 family RNA polymerase sigma factor [Acidobacteriota bacterium]